MFRGKKIFGEYKIDKCPFCGKSAYVRNSQGVPVCKDHKNNELKDMKCACGEYLEVLSGKWGPYFRCIICGNVSYYKGLQLNPHIKQHSEAKVLIPKKEVQKFGARKEVTVTSDELDFLY